VLISVGGTLLLPTAVIAARGDCDYLQEIVAEAAAVSLDDEEGQPAEVDVTGYDFRAYIDNLDFDRNFAKDYRHGRVLDVGAGWSDFVDVMADRYDAEAYAIDIAYGIDVSELSEECRELFYRRRIAMDAHRIQFPSNFFDLVVSHELLGVFFFFDASEAKDRHTNRQRIQRGMDIVAEMIRVANPEGEIRVTSFPDPYGSWYAENYPDLVNYYRDAYETLRRVTSCAFTPTFPEDDEPGVTVIQKDERCPKVDARSTVRVIVHDGRKRPPNR
jgi:hypothetical protein